MTSKLSPIKKSTIGTDSVNLVQKPETKNNAEACNYTNIYNYVRELDDYQSLAMNTLRPGMSDGEIDRYGCMRLAEEVGELNGRIARYYYHDEPWDQKNMKEELGDIMWYVAVLAANNDLPLSEIATHNIEKLSKRHGRSFSNDYHINK